MRENSKNTDDFQKQKEPLNQQRNTKAMTAVIKDKINLSDFLGSGQFLHV